MAKYIHTHMNKRTKKEQLNLGYNHEIATGIIILLDVLCKHGVDFSVLWFYNFLRATFTIIFKFEIGDICLY